MHDLNVLTTFTGGLVAALAMGFVVQRLGLSPIIGYLLAGIAVGPFTPGFVADRHVAEQFAEIGVILLLFGIGLRFHLQELFAVWRTAVPGAIFQSALSTGALALLLRALGWSWSSGVVLGLAVSVASTVVMALVLAERRDLHTPIGHIAVGWTVVEDLLTVTILLVLPMVFGPAEAAGGSALAALGLAGLKLVGLVAVVVVLGRWVIPWALERIEATRSRELFTLAVLALALGIAVGSARVFGVSMALGAFLAGLAVGRSEFAARAANDALPMRDAFAVLFFVSVGMLCDPRSFLQAPWVLGAVLLVVLIGKPLAAILVMRALGRPMSTALPVGAALAQIGEFSFILGVVARALGVLDDTGWNALVGASILSIGANPYLYRLARDVAGMAATGTGLAPGAGELDPRRCVLVGYGPVGMTLHHILLELGELVTVVELNLGTVRRLREEGHQAVYGDVLRPGTLEEAGIHRSGSLILAAEVEDGAEIVRQARRVNPTLRILARCSHLRDASALRRAGARVVAGEAEVAVALAEEVMAERARMEGREMAAGDFAARGASIRRRLYQAALPDGSA